jgi:hypothetical protein
LRTSRPEIDHAPPYSQVDDREPVPFVPAHIRVNLGSISESPSAREGDVNTVTKLSADAGVAANSLRRFLSGTGIHQPQFQNAEQRKQRNSS